MVRIFSNLGNSPPKPFTSSVILLSLSYQNKRAIKRKDSTMPFKSQASTVVLHRCGHEAIRLVKKYNPFKKKYETILDLDYLEKMRAPQCMITGARESLEKALPKTVEYWSQQDCPKCYKANLGTGRPA